MKKKIIFLGFLGLILMSCWRNTFDPKWDSLTLNISGKATNSITGQAINSAMVILMRDNTRMKQAYSDNQGFYSIVFNYPPPQTYDGEWYLIADKENYVPSEKYQVSFTEKKQKINIELTPK
jgi:hypothetical protein